MSLWTLPEEIIIYLAKHFLAGRDVVSLSHVCQKFFYGLQSDHLWSILMKKEGINRENEIAYHAKSVMAACILGHYNAREKLSYIFHVSVRRNWSKARHTFHELELGEGSKFGHDTRHLVKVQPIPIDDEDVQEEDEEAVDNVIKKLWHVQVWDICHPGLVKVTDRPLELNLQIEDELHFNVGLCAILVAKGTAVLCFSGEGEDTPQELVALDLGSKETTELWRDMIHDWGQFQLMRLFGRDLYKFDLLTDTIMTYNIRTYAQEHTLPLVEEMRYPHGEIAGDGKYLAVPGKRSVDNSPSVCVWNVKKATQKYLLPTMAFCPFRFFEKVAVSKGRVFGLLNRRCLFIWQAESGKVLYRIDLTDAAPGQPEPRPTFNYLSVHKDTFATINSNPGSQVIYSFSSDENKKNELKPVMPLINLGWLNKLGNMDYRVVNVYLNEHSAILHIMENTSKQYEALVLPLNKATPDPDPDADDGEEEDGAHVNAVTDTRALLLASAEVALRLEKCSDSVPSLVALTPTKLLSFSLKSLQIFDFLY